MRFGKIDYLNLLPFDVFIKAYPLCLPGFKTFLHLKKTYPAKLNQDFLFRRIDAGFISSIASLRAPHALDCGIIASKQVRSVLAIKEPPKTDSESASSNALCALLGIEGKVLIGDKALRFYYNNPPSSFIDLATRWHEKTHLPFVFGRLCVGRYASLYAPLARAFVRKRVKIPHYLLQKRAVQSGLTRAQILEYLRDIHYQIGVKEKRSLAQFARGLRFKRLPLPQRFKTICK
ncbi:MqnA/MqnD/SBP family protein [Helicobacter cynogastricus]|uniref:MqnA/MqnD/SBP family protein n=1 Tax=Helicobacter cynogastricus TaxID=329937 RepID=UPI000CF04421|nr:MqnA/MqnD/SBP family protein [Helicobacter cynogastricus]